MKVYMNATEAAEMLSYCIYGTACVSPVTTAQEPCGAHIHPAFSDLSWAPTHVSPWSWVLCVIRHPGDMDHGVCSEAILSLPVLLSLEGVLMRSVSSNTQSATLTPLVNDTLYRLGANTNNECFACLCIGKTRQCRHFTNPLDVTPILKKNTFQFHYEQNAVT